MTYIEQKHAHHGVIDNIRSLIAGVNIPNPLRLFVNQQSAPHREFGLFDHATRHDLGVTREYQDYSEIGGHSHSEAHTLHRVADTAQWNSFR